MAASLSHSFKVKPVIVVQQSTYPIVLTIDSLYNATCTEDSLLNCSRKAFHYRGTLIKKKENYETAKTVSFSYSSDLLLGLYEQRSMQAGEAELQRTMQIQVTGINEIVAARNATPKIALRFEMNAKGILELVSAKAVFEKLVPRKANRTFNANATANNTADAMEKVEERLPLQMTTQHAYPRPYTQQEYTSGKRKLDALDAEEEKVRKRAEAKSNYESAIYAARDWLKDDKSAPFVESAAKDSWLAHLDEVGS